jgi:multidrug transporter EmrE-like cation transporter
MSLFKLVLAIVLGVIATSLMEWLTSAPHSLDVLIGIVVALVFFFGYHDAKFS